jgi:hypothetical protein
MNTELLETYIVDKNGKAKILSTETVECQFISIEQTIAEKEAELIAIYNEIQNLKKEQ